ncbi:hypothetical protein E2C01_089547 [Portunus trituberculatus]|uniref:Uncharacterized protein n=1 Tax=Portunus trituberculatus TaxID=210409 RepID=A0A5B7JCB4_PORTR|nr:hypothetical protein [Portunus trituberculatus]
MFDRLIIVTVASVILTRILKRSALSPRLFSKDTVACVGELGSTFIKRKGFAVPQTPAPC